ncbi:MAG: radical SAM protein, partial [Candidatus Lokiarchaeota archaeon]|nr:radical SAM protein [Candidatus Lokiarchaeota archaeon]
NRQGSTVWDLNTHISVNYSLINLKNYEIDSIPLYSQHGCLYRQLEGRTYIKRNYFIFKNKSMGSTNNFGCSFCSRINSVYSHIKAENYLKMIDSLINNLNVKYFHDRSESYTQNISWLSEVKRLKLTDYFYVDYKIEYCLARVNEINDSTIKMLKEIGIKGLVLGLESGSDIILKNVNKGITCEQILTTIKKIKAHGLNLWTCFILGLPGETQNSLSETRKMMNIIKKIDPDVTTSIHLFQPMPNSFIWNKMLLNFGEKYKHLSYFDLEKIQFDYFRLFFNFNYKQYITFRKKLVCTANELNNEKYGFLGEGWLSEEFR